MPNTRQKLWLFLLLIIGVTVPFLNLAPLFDWDEINFAECSREMLVSCDFFKVQMNFSPFYEKPPFYFWLQSLCMALFGITEFSARFPNVIATLLLLLTLYNTGKRWHDEKMGLLWVFTYAGSMLPQFYFRSGIIDPWFNLFIFWNLITLFEGIRLQKKKYYLWAGLFCGLAVITKGPAAILITGIAGLILFIKKKGKIHFSGWIIWGFSCLSISSIWFLPETLERGPDFLISFFTYQWELMNQSVASHGQPWFYHPLVILFGVFPTIHVAIPFLFRKQEQGSSGQWMQWCFWIVLILFSIVKTKIIHYSSLCYIPITYGAALWWISGKKPQNISTFLMYFSGITLALAFWALYLIPLFSHHIPKYIKMGDIALAAWNQIQPWPFFAFVGPLLFTIGLFYSLYKIKYDPNFGMRTLLMVSGFSFFIMNFHFVPGIAKISQGGAIELCRKYQGEGRVVVPLHFKTYITSYYGQCRPEYAEEYKNVNNLIHFPQKADIYFLAHQHREKDIKENYPQLQTAERKGGFVMLYKTR